VRPILSRQTIVQVTLILGLVVTAVLVRPFLEGILWGLVFAAASRPIFQSVSRRLPPRYAKDAASVVSVLAAMFSLAVPLVLIGLVVWSQLAQRAGDLSSMSLEGTLAQVDQAVSPLATRLGVELDLAKLWAQYGSAAMRQAGVAAMKAAQSGTQDAASMGIGLICQFFLLRDDGRWRTFGARVMGDDVFAPLAELVYRSTRAILKGVVVVAVIQGVVLGVALAIAGVQQWVLLMVATMFLSMIPLVGPPVVFIPVSLMFMSQGDWVRGLGILAFGAGVVSQIDNVLRPIFIGNDTGLHPLVVFFGLLGGVVLLGPVGLFAGPVAIAVTLHFLRGQPTLESDGRDVEGPKPVVYS
jgi:predicted PurR-regulated permease PerM